MPNFEGPPKPPLEGPPKPSLEDEKQIEKIELKNTADFRKAIERGDLDGAEKWMRENYGTKEDYGDKWLEDRQEELLRDYCEKGNKEGAQRIIEETKDPFSQEGRINKFIKFFGPYEGKQLEMAYDKEKTETLITNSTTFKQALSERRIEDAEKWLEDPETQEKYKEMPNVLRDRQGELEKVKEALEKNK